MNDYLRIGPRLPAEDRLTLVGFLSQYAALERDTGSQINIVLTAQPLENDVLPIIFDNEASRSEAIEPENWEWILSRIQALRDLKNRVFRDDITEKCLDLFR